MKRQRRWDRYAIKAAIHRRGKSLTDLALESGLEASACRVALIRPFPSAEKAIADFLGIDPRILWPERHGGASNSQQKPKPASTAAASPIGRAA